MKTLFKTTFVLCIAICFYACKQNNVNPNPQAGAMNVTNAVNGGVTLDLTTSLKRLTSNTNTTVSSNGYSFLPLAAGQQQIMLGVPAIAATTTSPATPAVTYYTGNFNISATSNYSLFLTGSSPSAVENVLIAENYTRTYADSVCGVRFIHLATGSDPISVDIAGNANGSEVSSLAYKTYSGFMKHPANSANPSYTFEFRDQASGTLLTTYTLNAPYFHNVTLAFAGIAGNYTVVLDKDF